MLDTEQQTEKDQGGTQTTHGNTAAGRVITQVRHIRQSTGRTHTGNKGQDTRGTVSK